MYSEFVIQLNRVIKNSPAEKAGMRPQDIIIGAAGFQIKNYLNYYDVY